MFAGITDRPATEVCYKAGVGARIPLSIGATLDPRASWPVETEAVVKFLLPEANPARREVVVQIEGVTLVLTAYRRPYHDIADFTRLGVEPKLFKIIVVKSGYLSPELVPLANPSLMALSDGAINQSTCPRIVIAGRVTRSSRTSALSRRSTRPRGIDRSGGISYRLAAPVIPGHTNCMPMKDLAVLIPETPSALADMGQALGRAGVSIEGGAAFVVDGRGIAHFLFENGSLVRAAL